MGWRVMDSPVIFVVLCLTLLHFGETLGKDGLTDTWPFLCQDFPSLIVAKPTDKVWAIETGHGDTGEGLLSRHIWYGDLNAKAAEDFVDWGFDFPHAIEGFTGLFRRHKECRIGLLVFRPLCLYPLVHWVEPYFARTRLGCANVS